MQTQAAYSITQVPTQGKKLPLQNGKLIVPDQPIIPFIEGRWHWP